MTSSESNDQVRAGAADAWAICCSGGGIRSAAYCLGALQSLDQAGLVAKARWILGVSGGGYIAASRGLVAHDLPAGTKPGAYAPGTPEEGNLRCDTRYLAPNMPTILVGVLSLLLGAAATFVIALAPLYAAAHAWGWLLRWRGALVPSGPHAMTATVTGLAWWLPSVVAAGIVLVLFGCWWWTLQPDVRHPGGGLASLRPDDRDRGDERAWLVGRAALLAAALALAMLAVPPLISWLTRSTGSLGSIAHFLGFGGRPSWSLSGLAGLIAAVAAVARYCQAGLAKWTAAASAARCGSAAPQPGLLGKLAGRIRQLLVPWLGSAVVVLIVVVLALLWVGDGARAGYSPGHLLPVGIALAVVLLARLAVNVNRLSMHDFYRWRLADAFAVTRPAALGQNPWAHGRFRRPGPAPGLPEEGDIWVCKLGWWTGAPWDVRAYARQHPSYPCDSTLEQLYDAAEFEAYQQLGAAAVKDAGRHCQPPPVPGTPVGPFRGARPPSAGFDRRADSIRRR